MKIKRANFVLSLKDYWLQELVLPKKNPDQITIREQIMLKNKSKLDALMHQMQMFQKELLHFSNNMEYYIKTRAIQSICNELDAKLVDIQRDVSGSNGA